jgi:uncharacterized protein YcfJ
MGALTENHRCPRGRFSRVTDAFSTVMVGAVLGGLVPLAFGGGDPPLALVLAAAALGAVLARAVRDAIGPHL